MKLKPCKHCGYSPELGEGMSASEFRIECSNSLGCRAWIRIYSIFKRYAVEAWNNAN